MHQRCFDVQSLAPAACDVVHGCHASGGRHGLELRIQMLAQRGDMVNDSTARCPSGSIPETAVRSANKTSFKCTMRSRQSAQTRAVLSLEPVTILNPSGVTATDSTLPVWPVSTRSHWPVASNQTRTVVS